MLTRLAKIYSFFSAEMKPNLFRGELAQGLDHVLDGGRAADEANVGDDADVLPLESLARTREEARSAP